MDAAADEAVVVSGNGKGDNALGKEEWTDPGIFWTGSTNQIRYDTQRLYFNHHYDCNSN